MHRRTAHGGHRRQWLLLEQHVRLWRERRLNASNAAIHASMVLGGGVGLVLVLDGPLRLSLDGALVLGDDALRSHAHAEALLQAALLALAPHVHVNLTVVAVFALVDGVLRDAAPEEALGEWKI